MIMPPILTTSLIHFLFERFRENVVFELGSERVQLHNFEANDYGRHASIVKGKATFAEVNLSSISFC